MFFIGLTPGLSVTFDFEVSKKCFFNFFFCFDRINSKTMEPEFLPKKYLKKNICSVVYIFMKTLPWHKLESLEINNENLDLYFLMSSGSFLQDLNKNGRNK